MKKTILSLIILSAINTNASQTFNVIVDNKEAFLVGGFTETIIDSGWYDVGSPECYFDKELNDVYFGKEFTQTEICEQDQEKIITKIKTFDNGEEIREEKKYYKTVETTTENNVYGTHLEANCKDALAFDSLLEDGIYKLSYSGSNFDAYCDMTSDGGGWTLLMMTREGQGNYNHTSNSNVTNSPNYDSWTKAPHNSHILDINTNTTTNVVTEASTKVPFKEIKFEYSGSFCSNIETGDLKSIYTDTQYSLFGSKSGAFNRVTSTSFPFNIFTMHYDGGNHNNPTVPTDKIYFNPQCAKATFRPYYACTQIGIVGVDYYSFQNAIGYGTKGWENYAETNYMNSMLGGMYHRGFIIYG